MVAMDIVHEELHIPPHKGRMRALFYEQGAVLSERLSDGGDYVLQVQLPKQDYERILQSG